MNNADKTNPAPKKKRNVKKGFITAGCVVAYLAAVIGLNLLGGHLDVNPINNGDVFPESNCPVKGKEEAFNVVNYKGKKVVINFWGTWCGGCVAEMPDFNEAKLEVQDSVYMIALADNSCAYNYADYVDKHWPNYKLDFGVDVNDKLYWATGGTGNWPRTIIINTDGTVSSQHNGLSKTELLAAINEAH